MAYEILNSLRTRSVIRVTGNTATRINLSQLSANSSLETVNSASLTHVITATDGKWVIYRGNDASGPVLLSLFGSNDLPFSVYDVSFANGATSNIYVTNSGTDGTLIMQFTKVATYSTDVGLL
jgi:S-adenosylhomocysteine hydrolase